MYRVPCNDCNAVYIRQTYRHLKTRLKEHGKNITNSENQTALTRHRIEQDHQFNYAETTILDIEQNLQKRLILEMIHIAKDPHSINFRSDIKNLNAMYTGIFGNSNVGS